MTYDKISAACFLALDSRPRFVSYLKSRQEPRARKRMLRFQAWHARKSLKATADQAIIFVNEDADGDNCEYDLAFKKTGLPEQIF
jgi:hypothetical protein